MRPFFSIITVTKNSEKKIEKTIKSVKYQNYEDYQHIVIDGNSSDKTYSIIKNFNSKKILSKQIIDRSLYEGLNNALNFATGKYVIFLHAGDYFFDFKILNNLRKILAQDVDILAGGCIFYKDHSIKRIWRNADNLNFNNAYKAPHTSVVIKLDTLKKIGYFDTNYLIASDTESILRLLKKPSIKILIYNNYICFMELGGLSTNLKFMFLKIKEDLRIYLKYYKSKFLVKYFLKILSKIPQFFISDEENKILKKNFDEILIKLDK
jgi:glycosyltransferase